MLLEAVRHETFESEGIVKYYDYQDRIVEISFIQSGNGCTIQYIEPPRHIGAQTNERVVRWNTGQVYRTWVDDEGITKFVRLKDEQEWHY